MLKDTAVQMLLTNTGVLAKDSWCELRVDISGPCPE